MTQGASITWPAPMMPVRDKLSMWLPVAVGLLLLYVPTYRDIAGAFWDSEQGADGPVVFAMWCWLLWRERSSFTERRTMGGSVMGWVAIAGGAAFYVLGRSQEMYQLEAGSQLAILPGVSLVLLGPASTRRLWFAWFFLLFTVPLPGSLVDWVLVPVKELVSGAVTWGLFHAGLPVARDGVVIYAGPYRLFIADACSGLNSIVALTAVGLLYVYADRRRSRGHDALLLVAILPVAILANLLRVTALVLATYYGGDALGQRLHDYMSYVEIAVAFAAFFVVEHLARSMFRREGA